MGHFFEGYSSHSVAQPMPNQCLAGAKQVQMEQKQVTVSHSAAEH